MTQPLLVLEYEVGIPASFSATATSETHESAVAAVSSQLDHFASAEYISRAQADDVLRRLSRLRSTFSVWLTMPPGIVRGYCWGRTPVLTSEQARRALNCELRINPEAVAEGC